MPGELTEQQVLEQLRTRGYESGGFGSPLRDFWGVLTSITGSMVQRGTMPQARLEVNYNFDKVEVLKSSEPYQSPVAQISLLHSNRIKSGMGVLGDSMDKIINAGLDENAPQEKAKNQDCLIGKRQHWAMTPGHMMWDAAKATETPRDCWEVVAIEGLGQPVAKGVAGQPAPSGLTAFQQATNLLDGRTQQEWNSVVFQDTLVKSGGGDLLTSIINQSFIPPLLESGLVTKDANGVFHTKK